MCKKFPPQTHTHTQACGGGGNLLHIVFAQLVEGQLFRHCLFRLLGTHFVDIVCFHFLEVHLLDIVYVFTFGGVHCVDIVFFHFC